MHSIIQLHSESIPYLMQTRRTRSESQQYKNKLVMEDFTQSLINALKSPEVRHLLIDDLAEKVSDKVHEKIRSLELKLVERDVKIQNLETKISTLEEKLDEYEQYSRRENLRIVGLKESPKEDVIQSIIQFSREKLKIDLSDKDISRAHRVGPKDQKGKSREIIIRFTSNAAKTKMKSEAKVLKGSGIFINDDLTKKRAHLLYQARLAKRRKDILDAWTFDGRVAIKDKRNKITTVKDINQLEQLCSSPLPSTNSNVEVVNS